MDDQKTNDDHDERIELNESCNKTVNKIGQEQEAEENNGDQKTCLEKSRLKICELTKLLENEMKRNRVLTKHFLNDNHSSVVPISLNYSDTKATLQHKYKKLQSSHSKCISKLIDTEIQINNESSKKAELLRNYKELYSKYIMANKQSKTIYANCISTIAKKDQMIKQLNLLIDITKQLRGSPNQKIKFQQIMEAVKLYLDYIQPKSNK